MATRKTLPAKRSRARADEVAHHPNRQKALGVLAQGPLTKTELARATFGRVTASTRSQVSVITGALSEAGLIAERSAGRERIVELTDTGRSAVSGMPRVTDITSPPPALPSLAQALEDDSDEEHAGDRVRYHLRHAAMLALWQLRSGNDAHVDDHYEGALIALVDNKTPPEEDRRIFDSLAATWRGVPYRKRLIECLVKFENPAERRRTGPELVELGSEIESGTDAVLWASAAIDLAHHYTFAPASQIERLTARRLLRLSKDLMVKAKADPHLAVAASYRFAKTSKVAAAGWTWIPPKTEHSATTPNNAFRDDELLAREVDQMNTKVKEAGKFNELLEQFDRALGAYVGRWVMSALPSTEWIFRRAGGADAGKAVADWGEEARRRGVLAELLIKQVASTPELQSALRAFRDAAPSRAKSFPDVVAPHIDQAKALLGEEVSATKPQQYEDMLLNNLWSPEMVAADVLVPRAAVNGELS